MAIVVLKALGGLQEKSSTDTTSGCGVMIPKTKKAGEYHIHEHKRLMVGNCKDNTHSFIASFHIGVHEVDIGLTKFVLASNCSVTCLAGHSAYQDEKDETS